ncbi:MAG: methyltransferase domain-containing protein [Anaerolineaceae bacterium]|nr:methyltransferase domain-containing protein [Anaerolineaceae bacterium]
MNPELTLADWHARFQQQAGWTADIRRHLFEQAELKPGSRVLEVGCGTGAVMGAITEDFDFNLTGVDIDRPSLYFAQSDNPKYQFSQADGHRLPFADDSFDAVYCHYLLLWVADPVQVLAEMKRVTRPGGAVIALAEPDYAGRIDYPPPLDELGRLQNESLTKQGAEIEMGSRLTALFNQTGLTNIYTNTLENDWGQEAELDESLEWQVLRSDLQESLSDADLAQFELYEIDSRANGERVLIIPTWYAIGWVNG